MKSDGRQKRAEQVGIQPGQIEGSYLCGQAGPNGSSSYSACCRRLRLKQVQRRKGSDGRRGQIVTIERELSLVRALVICPLLPCGTDSRTCRNVRRLGVQAKPYRLRVSEVLRGPGVPLMQLSQATARGIRITWFVMLFLLSSVCQACLRINEIMGMLVFKRLICPFQTHRSECNRR